MIEVTPPPDRTAPGSRERAAAQRREEEVRAAALTPAERVALWLQLGLAVALETAFLLAGWTLYKSLPYLPIEPWQKVAFQVGLALAFLVFALRARKLWHRLRRLAPAHVGRESGTGPK